MSESAASSGFAASASTRGVSSAATIGSVTVVELGGAKEDVDRLRSGWLNLEMPKALVS
jgi:hypothetical protein